MDVYGETGKVFRQPKWWLALNALFALFNMGMLVTLLMGWRTSPNWMITSIFCMGVLSAFFHLLAYWRNKVILYPDRLVGETSPRHRFEVPYHKIKGYTRERKKFCIQTDEQEHIFYLEGKARIHELETVLASHVANNKQ